VVPLPTELRGEHRVPGRLAHRHGRHALDAGPRLQGLLPQPRVRTRCRPVPHRRCARPRKVARGSSTCSSAGT
jgi:hypothetical protein